MKIDKDIVALAIEELKAKNEKVNLTGVMRLTGYYYPDMIQQAMDTLQEPTPRHPRRPSTDLLHPLRKSTLNTP